MALFDFFKRRGGTKHQEEMRLQPTITPVGLLLNFGDGVIARTIDELLAVGSSATAAEKLLRAHLSGLFIDEKCTLLDEGVMFSWDVFYPMLEESEHTSFLEMIELPAVLKARPVLESSGSVSDSDFHVQATNWILDGKKIDVQVLGTPAVRVQEKTSIVSPEVHQLLMALDTTFGNKSATRSQRENELAWGSIRAKAVLAGAHFGSKYLASTIFLTPEALDIRTKKDISAFGHVYIIEPTFEGAPENWLASFDGFNEVQEHYDMTRDGGWVRVILSDPVRAVLEVVKREMPSRKVAGEKAEKFVHNPKAYLGDLAHGVLKEFNSESTEANNQKTTSTFHLTPNLNSGLISFATLTINEFYGDGHSQSFQVNLENQDALIKLTTRIGDALNDGRLVVGFEEFDLTLDANAEVELERMLRILHAWVAQSDTVINLEDIYELSDYSERIEGIGIAKPIFVPVLHKEKNEDDEAHGWLPKDLTPMLKVMLPSSGESILIPLTKEWVAQYEKKVEEAESSNLQTVEDPSIPTPLETAQARVLLNGFKTLLGEAGQPGPGKKSSVSKVQPRRETLIVKSNFHKIDYVEARKTSLTPPEGKNPRLPSCLRPGIQLKAHQHEGVAWFQHLYSKAPNEVRGCLLADDMGLGKTLQLLNVLARIYEDAPDALPSLIIVPKSLLDNWASEIEKFFTPSFPAHLVLYGQALSDRKQPRSFIAEEIRNKGITDLLVPSWVGSNKVIITTYDVLINYEFSFGKQGFTLVICDEAQRIKNPAATVSRAVRKLKAKFRVACTGTPVENTLVDLWCLFDFFQPGLLGSLEEFFKLYRKPIECKSDDQINALRLLQSLIRPQTLRRTKKDIAADLPKKLFAVSGKELNDRVLTPLVDHDQMLKVQITDHQRILYKTGLSKLQSARQEQDGKRRGRLSFDALHFMKAVCAEPYCLPGKKFLPDPTGVGTHLRNSPKLSWVLDELELIKKKGEKAILFTEIREVQAALHYFLRETFGLKPFIVNGDKENRQSYIDRFSETNGFDVIILSPLAAGAGLNVVAANHVFHFTRAWNPAKENQATDRAYRIGQERDVIVYCPTIVDSADGSYSTFDERLDQLLKEKATLAATAIDGDDLSEMLNGTVGDLSITKLMTAGASPSDSPSRLMTLDDVDRLDGNTFEFFCVLLLGKMGFLLSKVTEKRQGDGGIDVIAISGNTGLLAQCKTSQSPKIGWDAIKEVVGGALAYQSRMPGVKFKKVAITNQQFNPAAVEQAAINQVELIERLKIEEMLASYQVTMDELDDLLYST